MEQMEQSNRRSFLRTVTAGAAPNLSSFDNQLFTAGQLPTPAQKIYVTEGGGVVRVLTNVNDFFEIEIPAGFPMEWDDTVGSVGLSGPGADNVSPGVTYGSPPRTVRFDVTSDFDYGEHVVITGLQFKNFLTPAVDGRLRLHSPPGTPVDADDKTVEIQGYADVDFFTATATSQVRLEWVNPAFGSCLNLHLVRKAGSPPANTSDGFPVVTLPCVWGKKELVDDNTGLSLDTTYCYALFVEHAAGYTRKDVKARPFDNTSGPVKWAYSTGAAAMAPPGLRFSGGKAFVYAVSNDYILHAVDGGTGGGSWPAGWIPYAVGAPAQARPPVLGFPVGASPNGVALLGSQNGSVHAVNAVRGGDVPPVWVKSIATMVQAAPAGNFTFGGLYPSALDLVFAGTKNSSAPNALVALDVYTGSPVSPVWSFDNNSITQNGDGLGIGIISSGASVHYGSKTVYFASRARSGGSSHTVWAVNFGVNPPQLLWSAAIGNVDGSPIRFGDVIYVGTNSGKLYALDAATGDENWSLPLGNDGAVKGFVFPNFETGDLFLATNSKIWSVSDNGTSGAVNSPDWPVTTVSSPSTPIVVRGASYLLVGASLGKLYQLDTVSALPSSIVILGDGTAAVGSPTIDVLNSMFYVGALDGVIYGVKFP